MSWAYLPLFTGDYVRDTQHLSMSEHGAYLKLLMHCWDQKGPAPLDERKLMGIVNARSTDEIEALRRVLGEFFVRMEDGFYNPRMQREIEKTENLSGIRSLAGRRGYEARAKHLLSKSQASAKSAQKEGSQASAKQVHLSPSPSPTSSPSPSPSLSPTPGLSSVETPNQIERVEATSRASRLELRTAPPDWIAWCQEKRPDLDPAETFERFRDFWAAKPGKDGRKLDWFATWRNWCRNEKPSSRRGVSAAELSDLVRELEARQTR